MSFKDYSMTIVMIHAIRNAAEEDMHPEDLDVGSLYRVELDESVTEDFADAALDVFHANVAIEQLDDFTLEVKGEDGSTLPINVNYDSYSQSNSGSVELIQE